MDGVSSASGLVMEKKEPSSPLTESWREAGFRVRESEMFGSRERKGRSLKRKAKGASWVY